MPTTMLVAVRALFPPGHSSAETPREPEEALHGGNWALNANNYAIIA